MALGPKLKKTLFKSKVTKRQAIGVGGVGGVVTGVLVFVRSQWPALLPWETEGDAALVGIAATILGPLLSRFLASRD